MQPIYEHDCPHCKYLGVDTPAPGEPKSNVVDMYICTQGREKQWFALIRRYGSEPANYGCTPLSLITPRYQPVLRAAVKQKVIEED